MASADVDTRDKRATPSSLPAWAARLVGARTPMSGSSETAASTTSRWRFQSPSQMSCAAAVAASAAVVQTSNSVSTGRDTNSAACMFKCPPQLGLPPPAPSPEHRDDDGESNSSWGAAEPRGSSGREESEEREQEDVNADEEESDDEESEGDDEPPDDGPRAVGSSSSKLWGPAQYPEGTKSAHAYWDWANIKAAQAWSCPCPDRVNCIGADRLKPEELLIHRKEYLTTLTSNKRDAARLLLADHYSADTRACSRSFVVGRLNDCCAASRGLADGNSWSTWSRARADLRLEKPLHAGRRQARDDVESDARRIINAHIRDLRLAMDGSKGGSRGGGKTFTGKLSKRQRWDVFKKDRTRARLPIVGSEWLYSKCWSQQDDLIELTAKGHALCDECASIRVLHDTLDSRTDEAGRQLQTDLQLREDLHAKEHRGERHYADDMWHVAENHPGNVTMMNMDAPTQDQLEIPVQPKQYRDVAKSLEEAASWVSKMMGVMMAGIGMLCFVAHQRLGGGSNLSCTCVYMTLLYMHEHKHKIGRLFRLLLDNTTGDNKNNTVIFFICWLVLKDHFEDAAFFCMLKGHTYTSLDRTFNTMMQALRQVGVYCLTMLYRVIWSSLRKYNCLHVFELHALWDWKEYFKPHIEHELGGFATSQFGSGMHEFYVRKDSEGNVSSSPT